MTNLSPKAQAVMNAYYCDSPMTGRERVAAALRAVVAETQSRQYNDCYICGSRELLDVANELAQGLPKDPPDAL